MSDLYIQVLRDSEWRTVTTVRVEPKSHQVDVDREYARGFKAARQQISGWRGYFDLPLRIAEKMNRGDYREARA